MAKMKLWFTVISNLILYINCTPESEYDPFQYGIIHKNIGSLAIYNSHYVFPLKLYMSEIIGQYDHLHHQFTHLYELISPEAKTNITNSLAEMIVQELKEWRKDYSNSISMINHMFEWDLNSKHQRQKRGWVNAIGKASQVLFGTAVNSDILKLNSSLEHLLNTDKAQQLQINIHTKIMNITTSRISRINIVQKKLVNLVNDLADKFNKMDNFSQIIDENLRNSNAFSSLILGLMNLNQKTIVLKNGIEQMVQGRLSPGIVDTKSLRLFLSLIKNAGHSLIGNNDKKTLSYYYSLSEVHSHFDKDTSSILFLVSFPISFSYSKMFKLTQIISFPLNSKFSTIFTKYKVPKYIARNTDGLYMEKDTLDECKKANDIVACPLTTNLNKRKNESCAISLLENLSPPEAVCATTIIKLKSPEFYLSKGIWHYATPYKLEMNISCNDKHFQKWITTKSQILKGTGKLKIGMGCVGVSESIYLMQTEEDIYIKNRNYTFTKEIIPSLSIGQKLSSITKVNHLNITELVTNNDQQDLQELTSRLEILDNMNKNYDYYYTYYEEWSYATSVISIFALALTIFLLGLFIHEYFDEVHNYTEPEITQEEICNSIIFEQKPKIFLQSQENREFARPPLYENQVIKIFKNPLYEENIDQAEENKIENNLYVEMESGHKLYKDTNKESTSVEVEHSA